VWFLSKEKMQGGLKVVMIIWEDQWVIHGKKRQDGLDGKRKKSEKTGGPMTARQI